MGFMATPRTAGLHPSHRLLPAFPNVDIFMFKIAHLADRGIAILKDQSDFTRGKFNMGIFSFFRHQLAIGSCAPDDLSAFSHLQLDIMDQRTRRDISEWKGITRFDIGRGARDHPVPHAQLERVPGYIVSLHRHSEAGRSEQIDSDHIQWKPPWQGSPSCPV